MMNTDHFVAVKILLNTRNLTLNSLNKGIN